MQQTTPSSVIQQKPYGRWKIVVAAVIIQMCLGAVYAFSVLVPPLEREFGWTRVESSPAFTIALLVFALSMIPAGRLQDKRGPRLVAVIGGILLGLGLVLSSFTNSLMWLYLSYGLIGGLGIGLTYVTPITTCVKWFPDKKGIISGLAVFGFGAGSIVFAPLWTYLIEAMGWRYTLLVTGVLFTALVIPSAQLLKSCPEGYAPPNWKPPATAKPMKNLGPAQMLRTTAFFLIWASYWFGTTAGLMMIGHAKTAATEFAQIDAVLASLVVSILGLFNAFGRILWGFLGDRYGRARVLTLVFVVCATGLFTLALVYAQAAFILGVILVGLSFGGLLAIYPALTSDYYGTKNLGVNYGIVFTAYGAGAVLGPIMAGYFRTYSGSYLNSFYMAGALALAGIILSLMVKRFASKI